MRLGVIVAAVAGMAWGYVYATKDNLVQHTNPLALLSAVYLSISVMLIPSFFWYRKDIVSCFTNNGQEFISAIIGILVADILIMWSIYLLGGTEAGLIEVSYPLWTAIFSYLWYKKSLPTTSILGGILIMLGIYLIGYTNSKVE